MDSELMRVRDMFGKVKDKRASNTVYPLQDILMSGFAMFSLKYSSLLDFEQQSVVEAENLRRVYGIKKVCSDVQMRRVLDTHAPDFIRSDFSGQFSALSQAGILKEYEYKIGGDKYLISSSDGVQHFSSKSLSCPCCLTKEHSDGSSTYHHNMLCAALVHPDKQEVFMMNCEPIIKEDGAKKNDCERNAAKRLQKNMKTDYKDYFGELKAHKLLFVEDALYANGPHIDDLRGNGYSYILNVKPDSHTTLFAQIEGKRERKQVRVHTFTKEGVEHRFEWSNNVLLCNARPDLRVNFMHYQQTDKKGKVTTFTWVTNINLSKNNIWAVMKAGRSRWKIENETFNTLKNLGYNFEHNYGHGDDHLSTMFAYLMLLAFNVDQLVQACSKEFQAVRKAFKTKIKFWSSVKAVFLTVDCNSMQHLYARIATLYKVKLE